MRNMKRILLLLTLSLFLGLVPFVFIPLLHYA